MKRDELLTLLSQDAQYEAVLKSVSESERAIIEREVLKFVDSLSEGIFTQIEELSKTPEGQVELIKQLSKLTGDST